MLLIIDNHSGLVGSITRILDELKCKYIIKDQKSFLADINVEKIKGVILSGGGPDLDTEIDVNDIRADFAALINFDVPVLGICEGHEIIGYACGGTVKRLKDRVVTESNTVKILNKSKIFKGLPNEIKVYENHGCYVSNLPDFLELTATSSANTIEGFFHKTKPIYCVQFHPEESGEYGEKIIKNFVSLCK